MKCAYLFTEFEDYDYKRIKKQHVVIADKEYRWDIMKFPKNGPPMEIREIESVTYFESDQNLGNTDE